MEQFTTNVGNVNRRALAVAAAAALSIPLLLTTTSGASLPKSHTVTIGSARFEVLTPTLIRVEYATDKKFEDRPTQTALNRNEPVPHFTTKNSAGILTITTDKLTLTYISALGPFTPANLSITFKEGDDLKTARPAWDPCQVQPIVKACTVAGGLPGTKPLDPASIGGYTEETTTEFGMRMRAEMGVGPEGQTNGHDSHDTLF